MLTLLIVLILLGGWGGGVVGISSIDTMDASENETTKYRQFVTDRWYKVRLRVTPRVVVPRQSDVVVVRRVPGLGRAGRGPGSREPF